MLKMRIRIYSTEYKYALPTAQFRQLLTRVPVEMAEKSMRFRLWQDAYAFLFGKLLLAKAFKDHGYPFDLQKLQYTRYGRPFVPGAPDFNISHSGYRVICTIACEGRVGVDLEAINDVNFEDFSHVFAPEEWRTIRSAPSPVNSFYNFWTAKESLIKADGRGLTMHLPGIIITPEHIIPLDGHRWHLTPVNDFAGYACCIATECAIKELTVLEIGINELLPNEDRQM
jgi:4'-phosphopantetheinyl transferase